MRPNNEWFRRAACVIALPLVMVVFLPWSAAADEVMNEPESNEGSAGDNPSCRALNPSTQLKKNQRVNRKIIRKYEGRVIGAIDVSVNDIFNTSDPKEDRALYRFANRIQVNTREGVILQQLLFSAGDVLDLDAVEESLRILYAKQYLLDVKLYVTQVCDDAVTLNVVVRDAWVIEPKLSLGRQGGESSFAIGLLDGNFLGSGNEIGLVYEKNSERSKVIYKYAAQNFLGTDLEAEFFHEDLSDGVSRRFSLEKPFISVKTKWSYGISTESTLQRYKTRVDDEVVNEFDSSLRLDEAFAGFAYDIEKTHTHRLRFGVTDSDEKFIAVEETNALPEDEQRSYGWVAIDRVTNTYKQYLNMSFIGREEDVAIGDEFSLRFGHGSYGNGDGLQVLDASYRSVLSYSEKHLYQSAASANAVYNRDQRVFDGSTVSLEHTYYYFIGGKNRWYAHMQLDWGYKLAEYEQFTLGEISGVRAYPLAYQRGDKRYFATIERRFYSDIHWLNLIRVGAAAFIDFGRAWGVETYENGNHLASAGVGLRLHSSKTGSPAVIHLNVGVPLIENQTSETRLPDYMFSMSVEGRF